MKILTSLVLLFFWGCKTYEKEKVKAVVTTMSFLELKGVICEARHNSSRIGPELCLDRPLALYDKNTHYSIRSIQLISPDVDLEHVQIGDEINVHGSLINSGSIRPHPLNVDYFFVVTKLGRSKK